MFVIPASSLSALAKRHRHINHLEELVHVIATYNKGLCAKLCEVRAREEGTCATVPLGSVKTAAKTALATVAIPTILLSPLLPPTIAPVRAKTPPRANTPPRAKTPPRTPVVESIETQETLQIYRSQALAALEGIIPEADVVAAIESNWMQARGTLLEETTLHTLQSEGHDVVKDNKLWSGIFCVGPHRFKLIGRVDGLVEGIRGTTVIEIKNRVKNFFIPQYDLDQLAAYAQLTGASCGKLVQQLNGAHCSNTYSRDQLKTRWARILLALEPTLDLVAECQTTPDSAEAQWLARKLVPCFHNPDTQITPRKKPSFR